MTHVKTRDENIFRQSWTFLVYCVDIISSLSPRVLVSNSNKSLYPTKTNELSLECPTEIIKEQIPSKTLAFSIEKEPRNLK